MSGQSSLAIVIPAYKALYLAETLASIAAQTNQDFTLYVGDDGSPHDLKSICDIYATQLKLVYHRFPENLGAKQLVQHWKRCVELVQQEEWIWLFADDDLMEKDCVDVFYQSLLQTQQQYDIYRFNSRVVNDQNQIIREHADSPVVENAMQLAWHLLRDERGNVMPDQIVRRATYKALGGYVDFPYAQASDWATAIHFAHPKGLYSMPGPKIRWRYSGSSISSTAHHQAKEIIFGHLDFIEWITRYFNEADASRYGLSREQITEEAWRNLKRVMRDHYRGIPVSYVLPVARRLQRTFHWGILVTLVRAFRMTRTK
ncbi:glycosyltransferase family 2 protein [Siphonobacter sp.]|uniref:glycosyltransferase family 2 protein n=1 Tax=Siphonobacter sp. TaxID=1869184 RepID=UPI003B3B1523